MKNLKTISIVSSDVVSIPKQWSLTSATNIDIRNKCMRSPVDFSQAFKGSFKYPHAFHLCHGGTF